MLMCPAIQRGLLAVSTPEAFSLCPFRNGGGAPASSLSAWRVS